MEVLAFFYVSRNGFMVLISGFNGCLVIRTEMGRVLGSGSKVLIQ